MEEIAPMIVAVTLIITIGGVTLLRPISKRLGDLLELRAKQARGEIEDPKLDRMEQLFESMSSRLALLEERQDFNEALLRSRADRQELPSPKNETRE